MPAGGMRRTTRVFGVIKGADSARVLRSGRRLWPETAAAAAVTDDGGKNNDWSKPVSSSNNNNNKSNHGKDFSVKAKKEQVSSKSSLVLGKQKHKQADSGGGRTKRMKTMKEGKSLNDDGPKKMFGYVYSRRGKRKGGSSDIYDNRWGLCYSRRQRRKLCEDVKAVLSVVAVGSSSFCCWVSCFLDSVLRYVRRVGLTFEELSAFVLVEPLCGAYASLGIQFLQGPPTVNVGICKFFGNTGFDPLFSLDFSAVPLTFMHLHSAMQRRSFFRSFLLVNNLLSAHSDDDDEVDSDCQEIESLCHSGEREPSGSLALSSDVVEIKDNLLFHAPVRSSRIAARTGQYRNGLNSRGVQRKRSSRMKRKARNPLLLSVQKTHATLASDSVDSKKNSTPLTGVVTRMRLRSLAQSTPRVSFKKPISSVVDSVEDLDSSLCSANLLVTESCKGYRVQGVVVTLEMSATKGWLLTVKKDGLTRCSIKPERVMRPSTSNRFTYGTMFPLDNGWKLEFNRRQDWILFKNLYKQCYDHNIVPRAAKNIPVPVVREVPGYADSNYATFRRPDPYISMGDEISRALARRTAIYDIDAEDEEWLKKLNHDSQEHVSEDTFELMIDALEKAHYRNPGDFSDGKLPANLCRDLGSDGVVEAVHGYWMKKRKQKRSLPLSVFQEHQTKKAPNVPKPLLRKKRSAKRQPNQSVLQAAEQYALEERNALIKVEEAKDSARKSMELAILKRRRAQILMENADLATFKATMLVKIAEAAQVTESTDVSAGYFLD